MRTPEPRPVDRGDRRRWAQLLLGIVLFVVAEAVMIAVAWFGTAASGGSPAQGTAGWALLLGAVTGAAVAMGGYLLIVGPLGRSPGLALRGRGKLAELVLGLVIGAALIS
ncbi:MAG: hypothetical protein L0G94_18950, partial [Brachybacterium sp.]|nr:hypothetical protein [Brachybacterium sp.]